MSNIDKINNLYIKGRINTEEYEALISKHTKEVSPTDKIIEIIKSMSVEELLDTYDKATTEAEKKVIKLLIIAELEDRIG